MTINWAEFAKTGDLFETRDGSQSKNAKHIRWNPTRTKMMFKGVEHRQIPRFPYYYISADSIVRNQYGKIIKSLPDTADRQVALWVQGRHHNEYRHTLLHQAWPKLGIRKFAGDQLEYQGQVYNLIPDFPGYMISRDTCEVVRMKNLSVLSVSKNGQVYLSRDGKHTSRKLSGLYQRVFGKDYEASQRNSRSNVRSSG